MPRWKNVLQSSEEVYRIKRAAVLREATRIIVRRGYHNTSLDEVAVALGVSKGTLYNYVKDKQEILFECHQMALDIGDEAFAYADAHGKTGYGKLRLMLRAYLTWLNSTMGGPGVTTDVTALRPADQRTIIGRRDSVDHRMAAYLEEGAADGSARPVDAKVAVYAIMGAVNTVQHWYSPKGRLSFAEVVAATVDLLTRGVDTAGGARHVDWPVPALATFEEVRTEARGESATTAPKRTAAKRRRLKTG